MSTKLSTKLWDDLEEGAPMNPLSPQRRCIAQAGSRAHTIPEPEHPVHREVTRSVSPHGVLCQAPPPALLQCNPAKASTSKGLRAACRGYQQTYPQNFGISWEFTTNRASAERIAHIGAPRRAGRTPNALLATPGHPTCAHTERCTGASAACPALARKNATKIFRSLIHMDFFWHCCFCRHSVGPQSPCGSPLTRYRMSTKLSTQTVG